MGERERTRLALAWTCQSKIMNSREPSREYRDTPILSNAAGFDAHQFRAAVVSEAYCAMLYVPGGIYLAASLAHQAQRTNIGASLAQFL